MWYTLCLCNRNFCSLDFGIFSLPSDSQLTSETRWGNIEKRTRHFTETFLWKIQFKCLFKNFKRKKIVEIIGSTVYKSLFFSFYTVKFSEFLVFILISFYVCPFGHLLYHIKHHGFYEQIKMCVIFFFVL